MTVHGISSSNNRVFSISDRECPLQPAGGPAGVNYRLMLANRKYGFINHMYHIFKNMIIDDDSIMNLNMFEKEDNVIDWLKRYFKKLNDYFHFSDDDIYIFHDVFSAFVFISIFPFRKTVLVYHQQGSLYKELVFFGHKPDEELKKQLDSLLHATFMSMMYIGFPSKGAIESVIESEPVLENTINRVMIKILYNGCDPVDDPKVSEKDVNEIIHMLKTSQVPNFVTSATLNEAKGVERIPEFLSAFKKKYGSFLWVVVGDGAKADELAQNIEKYDIRENTIWLRKQIPHDDMLAIFKHTDFYILTHRFSIFDFSTIEAMGYGNIPILTPIGGNKKVIINNSGIFLNTLSSTEDFDNYVMNYNFDIAKQMNIQIARELFSEKAFLKRYADLIEEVRNYR